jgi:hypothetical protein
LEKKMNKQYFSALAVVGGLGATALAGVVGCGSGFASSDCAATRTCAPESPSVDGGSANAGASSSSDAGAPGAMGEAAGSGGTAPVGSGGQSAGGEGQTGTGPSPDGLCHSAADCSNGDPDDGDEVCDAAGACQPGNPPPYVVSVTPKDEATGIQPTSKVILTFNEPLDAATVDESSVTLLDGGVAVPGTLAYADSKVTFTPSEPLALLGDYAVSVSKRVTDADGTALRAEFSAHFSVRDGSFATSDAVTAVSFQMADTLPMNTKGEVLLVWTDFASGAFCPPLAQWFSRNAPLESPKALTPAGVTECDSVAAGGNAAGTAAVAWQVPDGTHGTYVQQYRAGKWANGDGKVSGGTASSKFRIAVAPSGIVTFFDNGYPGTNAYRTDASGKWAAKPDVLSSTDTALAPPEVVFDTQGNGLAVWRAKTAANLEKVLTARYTAASGKWAAATLLPGSLSSAADAEHERGAPALAMDENGDAMALWLSENGGGSAALMASQFSRTTGWASPVSIAASLIGKPTFEPPGLAFDGSTFVAAFTATDGNKLGTYTLRYDAQADTWTDPERRQAAADAASITRMPRLAGDARGNLLLVWATGTTPSFSLVYQRYAHGAWSKTTEVPGGSLTQKYFSDSNAPFPLTVANNGLAALAWGNNNASNQLNNIRLASFY